MFSFSGWERLHGSDDGCTTAKHSGINLTWNKWEYLACLSVCLFPIYGKNGWPIGLKYCVGPHMTPSQNYKKETPKTLDICKIWKSIKNCKFFIIVLSKRKCWIIEQQFKALLVKRLLEALNAPFFF